MQAVTALRGWRADGGQAAGQRRLLGHLLIVPTAVWTVAFFLIPLVLITVFSFGTENLVTFNVDFGWTASNYAAFGSALYVGTLLRSLALSLGTTVACALLGFPLAFFISRQAPRTQRVLLACVAPCERPPAGFPATSVMTNQFGVMPASCSFDRRPPQFPNRCPLGRTS